VHCTSSTAAHFIFTVVPSGCQDEIDIAIYAKKQQGFKVNKEESTL
jgi:hypothetical protein